MRRTTSRCSTARSDSAILAWDPPDFVRLCSSLMAGTADSRRLRPNAQGPRPADVARRPALIVMARRSRRACGQSHGGVALWLGIHGSSTVDAPSASHRKCRTAGVHVTTVTSTLRVDVARARSPWDEGHGMKALAASPQAQRQGRSTGSSTVDARTSPRAQTRTSTGGRVAGPWQSTPRDGPATHVACPPTITSTSLVQEPIR